MKNKIFIALIFIVLLSITAVNAADDATSDIISADDNEELILDENINSDVSSANENEELILEENGPVSSLESDDNEIIGGADSGVSGSDNNYVLDTEDSTTVEVMGNTFSDIQMAVDSASEGDTLLLNDITYLGSGNEILVDKSLTFIGDNTVLDGQEQSAIFKITENVFNLTFKNIKFRQGQREQYSLIYSESHNINIINCSFCDNDYSSNKSDVMINNSNANVIILNSSFYNNSQSFGYYNYALGALWINGSSTIIDNCVFRSNGKRGAASFPAALGCNCEKIVLTNSVFASNINVYLGAIVELTGRNITVVNCSFENNTKNSSTDVSNGMITLQNTDFGLDFWQNPTFYVENCTFRYQGIGEDTIRRFAMEILCSNHLASGGESIESISDVTVRNCLFEDNRGGITIRANNTILENCSFKNTDPYINDGLVHINSDNATIKNFNFENAPSLCIYLIKGKINIYNTTFKNTLAGIGDVFQRDENDTLTVKNCSFINSTEGAIHVGEGLDHIVIDDCSFIDNSADNGGAINISDTGYWRNTKISITNCLFENNTASGDGGAIYISKSGNTKDVLIENCSFVNNSAESGGGAAHIIMTNTEKCLINICTFVSNSAHMSSVIHLSSDNTNITNCRFEKNNVSLDEGALLAMGTNNAVVNCSFINNTGNRSASALYLYGNYSIVKDCRFIDNSKGACVFSGSNNIFTNCTFINNSKQSNGTSASGGAMSITCDNGVLANSTFDNNYLIVTNSETSVANSASSGAIIISANNVTVENCRFIGNHVEANVTDAFAGAVRTSPDYKIITLKNCSFINNYIKNDYGTSYGGAFFGTSNKTTLLNCSFINNSAIGNNSCAGAVAFFGDSLLKSSCNDSAIIDCIFENNYAVGGHAPKRYGDLGGGAIHYGLYEDNSTHRIINSIFKNNKVSSHYLNFTEEDGAFKLSLEGYEKYMHAIFSNVSSTDFKLILSNVSYWDGEMLNTNVAPVESLMASNQPIVFEFYDPRGKLVDNITKMTDSNGQAVLNFSEITEGIYTYVIYHPDNAYYDYILGAEGNLRVRSSFSDLREKINQATDSITLKGDYIYNSSTDSGLHLGININKNLTIYGDGHFIDGNGVSKIFNVANGVTLTIIDLTLNNTLGEGGAIYNDGDVTIINSTISYNTAYSDVDTGGAIFNAGNLTIIGSTLNYNEAYSQSGGGAIYNDGDVTIINSTLSNNTAPRGGAIYNYGSLKIDGSILENNIAEYEGGAIYNLDGTVTINSSTFRNNTASEGAAIWTNNGEKVTLIDTKFVDQGSNPIKSEYGEVNTDRVRYLTAVAFEMDDINDFLNGSSITINVREIIKGAAFNGNVTVSIGNNNFVIEVLNGVGSKTVTPDVGCGDHVAKLFFAETDVYDCASAQSNVFHVMNYPAIKVSVANIQTGDSFTVKISAVYTFNGALNVVINGVTYAVNVVNGAGSKTISTNLNPGTYTAIVNFAGNENFTSDSATASFTVSKRNTAITASAVTATYSVSKNLVATLKDKAGKAISGVKVTIKINGKTYTKTTDKNGQVKLGVSSLIPKTYTATITYAGNSIYNKATKSVKVTVKKATPKMTAKAKTFKVKVKTKKYTITLKNNKGKVMKNTKVTLKVNKKTFKAKTNKKGVATFKITNLKKKGKYTAVIKYAGSKYYNKVTKKPKITIKK